MPKQDIRPPHGGAYDQIQALLGEANQGRVFLESSLNLVDFE